MAQLVAAAALHQQVPANQIWQTRTMLKAIVPGHRAIWSKLGACEDFLKRSTVLERDAHQAGNHVVEPDQFRRAIRRLLIIMDAEVERALAGDFDFLSDVMTAGRERTARTLTVAYIVHAVCKSL